MNLGSVIFRKKTSVIHTDLCESIFPCPPSSFLSSFASAFSAESFKKLKKSILNAIRQLPSKSDKSCMIIEFEEPLTRSRSLELICSYFSEDVASLKNALRNAFYFSNMEANVVGDFPIPTYLAESFQIKIWEENRLVEENIIFDAEGIKRNEETPQKMILYNYQSIAKDKKGNICAFWYLDLKLPKELSNWDPNCCFTFNLKNNKNVYICSADPLRCIKHSKMLLLRMKISCLSKNRDHLNNPFENENTVSPSKSLDFYNKVLYDDSFNGIWKGLVIYKMLWNDKQVVPDNPTYLKIENGYLFFFKDENIQNPDGSDQVALDKLIIRNLLFTCDVEYTCDISSFIRYFKEEYSADQYEIDKIKADISKVSDKIPNTLNKDSCCTILTFQDENISKSNYIICTADQDQGINLKRALSVSLNNIILDSNIKREIPLARTEEIFSINYYNPITEEVSALKVSFFIFSLFY
jgi:hypothetical protein